MCFDGRKPEAAPLMRAAAEYTLPERLRVIADAAHAGATEVEHQREVIADQAREIARLKALLGEWQRGRRGEE